VSSARGIYGMSLRTPFVLLVLVLLPPVAAQARPLTTAPTLVIDVHVTVTNTRIVLDRHRAPRGVEARFILMNITDKAHNFTLDTRKTAGGVRGLSRTLEPHQRKIVRLFLDYRGTLTYFGGLPADRGKPGMRGLFAIV
jgi:hypothetical protein